MTILPPGAKTRSASRSANAEFGVDANDTGKNILSNFSIVKGKACAAHQKLKNFTEAHSPEALPDVSTVLNVSDMYSKNGILPDSDISDDSKKSNIYETTHKV